MLKNYTNQTIWWDLRRKGLVMKAFHKVLKPLKKPSSSLKISHLHKNQTEILITKSKHLGSRNDYLCDCPSFFATGGCAL